jgi:hypothetical protein
MLPIFPLISAIFGAPFSHDLSLREFSSLMHYSVANYCPSTSKSLSWDCKVYVSVALAAIEPKINLFGAVSRCGDDDTYGNDNNSKLVQIGKGFDLMTGISFYAGYNDLQQKNIISFKGTDSIQSAFIDLAFVLMDGTFVSPKFGNDIKIHSGFMLGYNKLKSSVKAAITELRKQRPQYEIVFTGHSLGFNMIKIRWCVGVNSSCRYCHQYR